MQWELESIQRNEAIDAQPKRKPVAKNSRYIRDPKIAAADWKTNKQTKKEWDVHEGFWTNHK